MSCENLWQLISGVAQSTLDETFIVGSTKVNIIQGEERKKNQSINLLAKRSIVSILNDDKLFILELL